MVRKCVWMMRWCAFGMHLEAREERQNLFCLTSVLHLRTANTYADRPSPLSKYLRAFTDHSRSFTFPKRRPRIAVNGPQMRVDDVMVCVRDAPRSPRGTTEPVLSYICLTSADRYNTFADRPSPLGEYLRAFTDHSRSFTFPKRCNSSSELIRNLFGCSVFIRLSSDDNTNDSPVVFKRSRHWESRPPVSSQSAEDICPQKLDRSQTG